MKLNRDEFDLLMTGLECLYDRKYGEAIHKQLPPLQQKLIEYYHTQGRTVGVAIPA